MKNVSPKRIAIIGLPGSGKSTLACKLGRILNIPVHHIDKHMFEGKQKKDRQGFLSLKKGLVSEDAWIIEGCSRSTFEMRFARADTVIYLQFPRLLCIWRLCKRFFAFDEMSKESGCLKGINIPLLKYLWNFDREQKKDVADLRNRYPQVNFMVFRKNGDLDDFLQKLKTTVE